jgi:preprotein translocase subunit SecA
MAGRGTDIKLGGNPELIMKELGDSGLKGQDLIDKRAEIIEQVEQDKKKIFELGGLLILATERHESRRIDNQLRGRAGRQGDPGRTKFFLSFEDDLIRIFASERIASFLQKYGLSGGEPITHPMISRTIEKAQKKVEQHNYEVRKNLLKFDDVMNDQRKVIYEQRLDIMEEENIVETITEMYTEILQDLVTSYIPKKAYVEQWDLEGLNKELWHIFGLHLNIREWVQNEDIEADEILKRIKVEVQGLFAQKEAAYGQDNFALAAQRCLLITCDQLWKDHLLSLDHLRQGISLRAYAQKDPLNEYKREAFHMFADMLSNLKMVFIERISHMILAPSHIAQEYLESAEYLPKRKLLETRIDPASLQSDPSVSDSSLWGKVGRNELCPCGSGRKFKHCHGQL